jgi:chemotaxis protein methyltransferase CheR
VRDRECVAFLQWALPRMGMRWRGFRKVRRQVCRRVRRRLVELGVGTAGGYRRYLESHPREWDHLASLCRITISRFNRDREVFRVLGEEVLPRLAADARGEIRVWSAGCASGEEPYTLTILWRLVLADRYPDADLRIVATDVDPVVLDRAREARYPAGALRDLEPEWLDRAFQPLHPGPGGEAASEASRQDVEYRLREEFRQGVELRLQDIRREMPRGPFQLVLCRNLAFTYFDDAAQGALLARILGRLAPGGYLVLGGHESLPPGDRPLERPFPSLPIHRRS